MDFVCAAQKAGLPVVVCNAGQVRQFAKATGRLAKSDKLDTQDSAHFSDALHPALTELKPEKLRQISDSIRPKIKSMYEHLMEAGKPKKVAIVACMPKQLTILNTMMKNGTHWDEKLA